MKSGFKMMLLLVVTSFVTNVLAQEVSIPEPGLNAAIRETLAKPAGPLTAQDLLSLTNLDASFRGLSSLEGLGAAHNLTTLGLGGFDDFALIGKGNRLTSLALPTGLTSLTALYLYGDRLTNFSFLTGLTNLTSHELGGNQLTSLTLPAGLTNLTTLDLGRNQLTDFSFLRGLTSLTSLGLDGNQLTNLTLPADLTSLTTLELFDNPLLKTVVLSEQLAVTGLAATVTDLRRQGVLVYVYPMALSLASGHRTMAGAFEFTLTGPPGAYTILGSADLAGWRELGTLTNELGTAVFTDSTVKNFMQNFYQARTAP